MRQTSRPGAHGCREGSRAPQIPLRGITAAGVAVAVAVAAGAAATPTRAQQTFSGSTYGTSQPPAGGPEDYFGRGSSGGGASDGRRPYPVVVPEARMDPAPATTPTDMAPGTPVSPGSRILARPAPRQAAPSAYPSQPATSAQAAPAYPPRGYPAQPRATAGPYAGTAAPQTAAQPAADPVPESLEQWSVLLGAGGQYAPVYPGSGESEFGFKPIFDARVGRYLFANNRRGVGVYLTETDRLKAGLAGNVDWGRDESDDTRLAGMGDIDASLELGGFADYQIGQNLWLGGDLKQSVTDGGHGGFLAEGHVTYSGQTANGLTYSLGPHVTWASKSYMESYFGVDAVQAANSGHAFYEPAGGFRDVGMRADLSYPVSEHVLLLGGADWSYLLGEAADSPLVNEANQISVYGGVGYQF